MDSPVFIVIKNGLVDDWLLSIEQLNGLKSKSVVLYMLKHQKVNNSKEMVRMMKKTRKLMGSILNNFKTVNSFIIDELNPDGLGFAGITMTVRNAQR